MPFAASSLCSVCPRQPPEGVPVGLVDGVVVDGIIGFQILWQEAESLHLADVVAVRTETGHIEPFTVGKLLGRDANVRQQTLIALNY